MSDKVHICNCPALDVLLEQYSTEYPVDGKTYYELPFWFEKIEGGLVMHFKEPEDLGMFIARSRLGNPNPQPVKKV